MGLLNSSYYDEPFDNGGGGGGAPYTPPPAAPTPGSGSAAPAGGSGQGYSDWVNMGNPIHGSGGGSSTGFGKLGGKPIFDFGEVPQFAPPEFKAPTFEDALNEPGYQFRQQAGENALQRSQAAQGLLRTGGSLKDLIGYGQKFASEEYGNVFNRALSSYDRKYQGAHDAYAPNLAQWQMRSTAEMQAALAQYNRQWEIYQFQHQYHAPQSPPPFQYNPPN